MNKRLPLSVGTILQSRYRINRHLGHGGMGAVYEAENLRVSALIALKETFADDDLTRHAFEREAKLLANMTHEAFPRVMDYFAEDNGCYLVMELIHGKDLTELLEERRFPFEPEQVLEWADQILDALEDLHSQNIVHRDIKPSNIKLTPRGRIKLLDFGIAKGAAGDMTVIQSTVGSMAAATLQYAPLEQILRADQNYFAILSVHFAERVGKILHSGTNAQSDLYALGATLYQLLTNNLPANAPTRALAVWSGQADKLRPAHEINPKVSPAISAVLQQAMEIEKYKRPSTAVEMRRLLREAKNSAQKTEINVFLSQNFIPIPIPQLTKKTNEQTLVLPPPDNSVATQFHTPKSVVTKLKDSELEKSNQVLNPKDTNYEASTQTLINQKREFIQNASIASDNFIKVVGGGIGVVILVLIFSILFAEKSATEQNIKPPLTNANQNVINANMAVTNAKKVATNAANLANNTIITVPKK